MVGEIWISLMLLHLPVVLVALVFLNVGDIYATRVEGIVDLGEEEQPRRKRSSGYDHSSMEKAGPPAPRIGAVYLLSDSLPELSETPTAAELAQDGLQFRPRVLIVQLGATVSFPNFDNTYHNVFSYSSAKTFDLGRYLAKTDPPSRIFDQAGEVEVYCEVHPHMRSTILVVPTSFYSTTSVDGKFDLGDVPPGDYKLMVWRNPGDLTSYPVTVSDQPVQLIDLSDEQ